MSHPSRPRARGPAQRRRRDLRIETAAGARGAAGARPRPRHEPADGGLHGGRDADQRIPGDRQILQPAELDGHLPVPGTDHDRLATDRLVVLRRRHRPDRGRPRRRLRQGCLRDLARWLAPTSTRSTGRASSTGSIPATGKSSVFFDLNTVIGAIQPGADRRELAPGPRPAWSTGMTSPSTPKATSTAAPRCSSRRPTPPTRTRTPSTGSPPTVRSSAPSSSSPSARDRPRLASTPPRSTSRPRAAELPARAVGRRDQRLGAASSSTRRPIRPGQTISAPSPPACRTRA